MSQYFCYGEVDYGDNVGFVIILTSIPRFAFMAHLCSCGFKLSKVLIGCLDAFF